VWQKLTLKNCQPGVFLKAEDREPVFLVGFPKAASKLRGSLALSEMSPQDSMRSQDASEREYG
jgi:hypothetical protein